MKKIFITIGILFVASLAIKDTFDRFKELDMISVIQTPAQIQMRQPAQQQTGQRQRDIQTQNRKRFDNNNLLDNSRNSNGNSLDNYNRNPNREKDTLKNPFDIK